MMALAEIVFGGGREVGRLILVHIGATIGRGLVIDHRVYGDDHVDTGRIGHIVVEPEGTPCAHGHRGCLETVATDGGIARLARRPAGPPMTASGGRSAARSPSARRPSASRRPTSPALTLPGDRAGDRAAGHHQGARPEG